MTTRALHEALRIMRIGLEADGFRARLLAEAVAQLEALEAEVRAAAARGTVAGSALLESIAAAPEPHYVVGITKQDKVMARWPVASEQEGREVADTQSQCPGQRSWRLRVYRGDMLLATYSNGHERSRIYWTQKSRQKAETQVPSALREVA